MDWNGNLKPFVPRGPTDNSFNLVYNNHNNYEQFPGIVQQAEDGGMIPRMEKNNYGILERKKRLSNDQLESLENSFQEEIKLDPDRKMKLAKDLQLHPRQIAVWFQNRRARWKAKQLERLYDALKQDFDVVCREKQKLQQEVLALRAILKDQATAAFAAGASGKQVSNGYKEISGGEETVESTSIPSSNYCRGTRGTSSSQMECNYVYNVIDEYNTTPVLMPPNYWTTASLPSYPMN